MLDSSGSCTLTYIATFARLGIYETTSSCFRHAQAGSTVSFWTVTVPGDCIGLVCLTLLALTNETPLRHLGTHMKIG
jgi:hypothetical protein